jgi:hypothetical protein
MYAIYLQSKKSIYHLILLSLGTVVLSGCSQSHQLEKVPENQQPSQPTSTKSPATEVLDGASDTGQLNAIEDASGVGRTDDNAVVSSGESDAGSAQPNTISEDASGVGKPGYDAVVSNRESDDTYLDPDADKSIYLVNTKGENAGELGYWPNLRCFWKTCTP